MMTKELRRPGKGWEIERVFDRLTLLLLNQEFMLNQEWGPLTNEQKAVLYDMTCRSKEIAELLRKVLDTRQKSIGGSRAESFNRSEPERHAEMRREGSAGSLRRRRH